MGLPVTVQIGTFPQGYCFTGLQQYFNDGIALCAWTVAGNFDGVIIGPNVPAPNYQGSLWIKTDPYGNPIGNFLYANGNWIWPHPIAPGDGERKIFTGPIDGSPAGLWSKDGGDGTNPNTNPPTATTGSFWTVDSTFAFAIPMGAGTNPVAYDGATSGTQLISGQSLGEERHVLTMDEMWHQHGIGKYGLANGGVGFAQLALETGGGAISAVPGNIGVGWSSGGSQPLGTAGPTSSVGGLGGTSFQTDIPSPANAVLNPVHSADNYAVSSHQNLPPVVGVNFIMRTARAMIVGG
jgi:hypothetical protein